MDEDKRDKEAATITVAYARRKESVYPLFGWEIHSILTLRNSLNSYFLSITLSAALTIGIAIGTASLSPIWFGVLVALLVLTVFFAAGTYRDRKRFRQLIRRLESSGDEPEPLGLDDEIRAPK